MWFLAVTISDGQVVAAIVTIAGAIGAAGTLLSAAIRRLYSDSRADRAAALERMDRAMTTMAKQTEAIHLLADYVRHGNGTAQ